MPSVATHGQPTVGAAVQPDTGQVLAWISPAGQLAHLIALPAQRARALADQLTQAAEAAEQLHHKGGEHP